MRDKKYKHRIKKSRDGNERRHSRCFNVIILRIASADAIPVISNVVIGNNKKQIYEALDAFGYMVYYNPVLATTRNCQLLHRIDVILKYKIRNGNLLNFI